jgi:hypothetical protein
MPYNVTYIMSCTRSMYQVGDPIKHIDKENKWGGTGDLIYCRGHFIRKSMSNLPAVNDNQTGIII